MNFFNQFVGIFIFGLTGLAFICLILLLQWVFAPKKPEPGKTAPYECGNEPFGKAWVRFPLKYYPFLVLFVVFDVETVFLFPWAVVYGRIGLIALIEAGIFVFLLLAGLIYAWKKDALRWT